MKKIIGISANTFVFEEGDYKGSKYAGVFSNYPEAVLLGGGVPVILPPVKESEQILQQLNTIDLLIISGGADLQPHLYGETPSPLLEKINVERDLYEMELVRLAYAQRIPIFGICRGLQIINVAFGGTLYQDISEFNTDTELHRHKDPREEAYHSVEIVEDSLLHSIFQEKKMQVNSHHHQGIKKLAPGFKVNARSPDGFIEGIEKLDGGLLLAVQWHPEMMALTDFGMLRLFQYLANVSS